MQPDDFYSRLATTAEPPPHLESQIASLVSIRRPRRLLWAAAAILAFLAGFATHAWRARTPEYTHVLFLSNGPAYRPAANPTERVREYRNWARGLDVPVTGAKLKPATSPLSGYFMIRARSLAEAQRIASTCPHVRHGGTIEVREIDR